MFYDNFPMGMSFLTPRGCCYPVRREKKSTPSYESLRASNFSLQSKCIVRYRAPSSICFLLSHLSFKHCCLGFYCLYGIVISQSLFSLSPLKKIKGEDQPASQTLIGPPRWHQSLSMLGSKASQTRHLCKYQIHCHWIRSRRFGQKLHQSVKALHQPPARICSSRLDVF